MARDLQPTSGWRLGTHPTAPFRVAPSLICSYSPHPLCLVYLRSTNSHPLSSTQDEGYDSDVARDLQPASAWRATARRRGGQLPTSARRVFVEASSWAQAARAGGPLPPFVSAGGAGLPTAAAMLAVDEMANDATLAALRPWRLAPAGLLGVPWPSQDIRLVRGLCTRINLIIRKHPLRLGTPLAPSIAHATAQYSVSPCPSFIAIHAIQL